jgi:ADP-sugar diphosphatase
MRSANTITIADKSVPLVYEYDSDAKHHDAIMAFKPFCDWIEAFSREQRDRKGEVVVKEVCVQSIDFFSSGKIGFLKFKADVELVETGKKVPGIVFMRGGAVAILLLLCSKDPKTQLPTEHVLLTTQPRIAIPSLSFPELPAGMLDGSGHFSGIAAQEIEEETGLQINESDLVDLTALSHPSWRGIYPSAGGSDEFLRLFMCTKEMPHDEIVQLQGKLTGLRDHGEAIKLKVVEFGKVWKEAPDVKVLAAVAILEGLKREGRI